MSKLFTHYIPNLAENAVWVQDLLNIYHKFWRFDDLSVLVPREDGGRLRADGLADELILAPDDHGRWLLDDLDLLRPHWKIMEAMVSI